MALSRQSLPVNFPGNETKRMAALDSSSCVFYHFARQSLRLQKDCMPGLMDINGSAMYHQISAALTS